MVDVWIDVRKECMVALLGVFHNVCHVIIDVLLVLVLTVTVPNVLGGISWLMATV